jgi:glycosyltransferase involved in cell wall biosynthesis
MKIAAYYKAFQPIFEPKDHAQIVLGLGEIGLESELFTLDKPAFRNPGLSVPVRLITPEQAATADYWRNTPYNAIIVYTRMDWSNIWMIDIMKKAGKTVLVKADTDGRKTFPVYPRDIMDYTYNTAAERARALYKRLKQQVSGRKRGNRLAEHVKRADGIIVETPQAFANIGYILSYWGMPELIGKVFVVPNPVSNFFTTPPLAAKDNLIVASGGWGSMIGGSYVKNTAAMVDALCRFLMMKPDYKAVVIGSRGDVVESMAKKWPSSENLHVAGYIPNDEAAQYVSRAKIVFQPSLYETFGIAVAEGLCMGCSVVGGPLESFHYLSGGGLSGTLATDFSADSLLAALLADNLKWERNIYSPEIISSTWRSLLNRQTIAKSYLHIAEQLS